MLLVKQEGRQEPSAMLPSAFTASSALSLMSLSHYNVIPHQTGINHPSISLLQAYAGC